MIYMIGKSARFTRSGILLILSILSNCFPRMPFLTVGLLRLP